MYYLWRDESQKDKVLVYMTDYLERDDAGKVRVDGHGYLDLKLIFTGETKIDCINHAQTLT